ncbi:MULTISPECIES: hypothetical protein [unclassified Streptomyces]|uniref:hypothetical protein n=1 Tax=unclassified Streptomyces TaxID=2593676 RepID=UPI0034441891
MPETTPNSKGPAPIQFTPETVEPALIPDDQVKPEDIAALKLDYRDGTPVIVATGGHALPAVVEVVNHDGGVIAAYAARKTEIGQRSTAFFLSTDTPGVFDVERK